jgi:hypothetical protein
MGRNRQCSNRRRDGRKGRERHFRNRQGRGTRSAGGTIKSGGTEVEELLAAVFFRFNGEGRLEGAGGIGPMLRGRIDRLKGGPGGFRQVVEDLGHGDDDPEICRRTGKGRAEFL